MFVGFYYHHLPAPVEVLVRHSTIVNAFAFSWSAATNVWATMMVAYKAWYVLVHLFDISCGEIMIEVFDFRQVATQRSETSLRKHRARRTQRANITSRLWRHIHNLYGQLIHLLRQSPS